MRIACLSILSVLLATTSHAADFTAAQYECSQIKVADGFRCGLFNIPDQGATMFVQFHDRPTEAIRQRSKYLLRKVTDSFLAAGGRHIVQRTKNPAGKMVERSCTRGKRSRTESCLEWDDIERDDVFDPPFKMLAK